MIGVVDAHVHFWDPAVLHYPWLAGTPLHRAFLPPDYAATAGAGGAGGAGGAPITKLVFVECNCRPEEARLEVEFAQRLAQAEREGEGEANGGPHIAAIIAFADLTDSPGLDRALDALCCSSLVKGARHNIQGQPAGFALQPVFVDGVQEVGRRGLTFDLCATHDQLREVAALVERCPDTQFVLDHCGKPPIRARRLEPWRACLARIAACENVCCKLSGLLTEAAPGEGDWRAEDLIPYATTAVESFGIERVMYGSDWPVLTLAGSYGAWFGFTDRFTAGWSAADRNRFYAGNAARVYGL